MLKIKALLLICIAWLFPLSPALACVSNVLDISVHRLVELAASVILTLMLLFWEWTIKRLFFNGVEKLSVALIFAFLSSVVFALIGYFVVPAFEVLFAGFGAELSVLTQWVVDFRAVFFLPTLLVFVFGILCRNRPKTTRSVLFVLCALNILFLFLALYAVYSPIFMSSCIE